MEKRITCKVHDEDEVIIKVGVEGVVYPMLTVWHDIDDRKYEAYTFEKGKKAKVYARETKDGTRYLTSHPDGYRPNNLDELPDCA